MIERSLLSEGTGARTPFIYIVPALVVPKSDVTSYTSLEESKLKFLSSFVSS